MSDSLVYFLGRLVFYDLILAGSFFLFGLWLGWLWWGSRLQGGHARGGEARGSGRGEGLSGESGEVGAAKGVAAPRTRIDSDLGLVYAEEPVYVDDLTQIRGVGEKMEGHLHELGIYTFEQIAQLTPPQQKALGLKLQNRGCVERDRWVEQVRRIAGDGGG